MPSSILVNLSKRLSDHINTYNPRQQSDITLCFEKDQVKAWELLLYWACNHALPEAFTPKDDAALEALNAWILGSTWGVAAFQDAIIKKLLLDRHEIPWRLLGTGTTYAGDELGCLLAEQVVYRVYEVRELTAEDVGEIQADPYFVTNLLNTLERYRNLGSDLFDYFPAPGTEKRERWRCFMVGDEWEGHYFEEIEGL